MTMNTAPFARRYQLIDHTADFGVRVFGRTLASLYENAGYAMVDQIVDRKNLTGNKAMALRVRGDDRADLLVNWLRELLFLWNGEGKLVKRISVSTVSEIQIEASLGFEEDPAGRHAILNEIKAVTYHQLTVDRLPGGWAATIIFDV